MRRASVAVMLLVLCACVQAPPAPAPQAPPPAPPAVAEAPRAQVAELERRAGQLELQLMERDAMNESLNARLEEALQEVVGAMAKLQSLATRAEAASAMAEADVALQSIAGAGGDSAASRQAARLMQQSTGEFKRKNFGGALYLANQAKAAARTHGIGARLGNLRPGEVPFAVPVKLRVGTRANVRNGPGMNFAIAFTLQPGGVLSGLSYFEDWVRVTNDAGIEGWVARSLVVRRAEPGR